MRIRSYPSYGRVSIVKLQVDFMTDSAYEDKIIGRTSNTSEMYFLLLNTKHAEIFRRRASEVVFIVVLHELAPYQLKPAETSVPMPSRKCRRLAPEKAAEPGQRRVDARIGGFTGLLFQTRSKIRIVGEARLTDPSGCSGRTGLFAASRSHSTPLA